jgi:hypothetical protein
MKQSLENDKFMRDLYKKHGLIDAAEMLGIEPLELADLLNLKFKSFNDLDFIPDSYVDGVYARMMFPNGYGVSVVRHKFSYGGPQGLYELAVLDKNGDLTYDTKVTNDVVGHLDVDDVTKYMILVQGLKSEDEEV